MRAAHLNGPVPHDLAQLGDVVVLLDGCPQVAVVFRLGCLRVPAKCALRRLKNTQEQAHTSTVTHTQFRTRGLKWQEELCDDG